MFFCPSPIEQFESFSLVPLIVQICALPIQALLSGGSLRLIQASDHLVNLASVFFCFYVLWCSWLTWDVAVKTPLAISASSHFLASLMTFCLSLVSTTLGPKTTQNMFFARQYAGLIFSIFLFLIMANYTGLLPFWFTVTSQLVLTFGLAFSVLFGTNWVSISIHGCAYFALFFPSGAPFFLAGLLVFVEGLSYVARVFSLSIRLFANMVAGHCLIKILAWFVVELLKGGTAVCYVGAVVATAPFIAVLGLELGIALLQAYVFCLLLTMYTKDCLYILH